MKINKILLLALLLLPYLTLAEGQWGLDYIVWTIDFFQVFGLWVVGAVLFLLALKAIRKKSLSKKQKYIFWSTILLSAFFHWSMITYDPNPTVGPIDSLFK
jgi:hypothetical protein